MQKDDFERKFMPMTEDHMREKSKKFLNLLESKGFQFTFSNPHHYGMTNQSNGKIAYGLIDSFSDSEIEYLNSVFTNDHKKKTRIKEMKPEFLDLLSIISKKSTLHYQVDEAYDKLITETFDIKSILLNDYPMSIDTERCLPYIRFITEFTGKIAGKIINAKAGMKEKIVKSSMPEIKLLTEFLDRNYKIIELAGMIENGKNIYNFQGSLRAVLNEAVSCIISGAKNKETLDTTIELLKYNKTRSIMSESRLSNLVKENIITGGWDNSEYQQIICKIAEVLPDDLVLSIIPYQYMEGKITEDIRRETIYRYYTTRNRDTPTVEFMKTGVLKFTSGKMIRELCPPYLKMLSQEDMNLLSEDDVLYLNSKGCELDWPRLFRYVKFTGKTLKDDKLAAIITFPKTLSTIYKSQEIDTEFVKKYPLDRKEVGLFISQNFRITDVKLIKEYSNEIDWAKFSPICVENDGIADEFYDRIDFDAILPGGRKDAISKMNNKDAICYAMLKYGYPQFKERLDELNAKTK
jgi:hypothetical protein